MSPDEVVRALAAGNTVSPSGNIRIGDLWPMVPVNSVVGDVTGLNNIPIRSQGTQTIFVRDVGSVEDGADIQTGYALVDGRRTVYIPVTKRAEASTLAVVQAVKANLPRFQSVLPNDIKVSYQFDQSPYVTGAIRGLFFEGALGVVLRGLMVLLFLRDWRSALVVVLNIPLAILASVTALWVSGQTINIMTLGGLALAVGFSMVGSYLLSRTFVPVLAVFPLMQTLIVLLRFHHLRKVGGQQRSALSRVLALKNGENGRQDDQRGDRPPRQAADHGATERCGLRAAFP
jgi:multidrug efflux pump subunit AcrB